MYNKDMDDFSHLIILFQLSLLHFYFTLNVHVDIKLSIALLRENVYPFVGQRGNNHLVVLNLVLHTLYKI